MNEIVFQNKYVEVGTFKNPYGKKMFSIEFKVDPASMDSYRGFPIKKAAKVAKWLKKAAKAIKGLQND